MRVNESHGPAGLGILVLQHHEMRTAGFSVHNRASLWGTRVLDRMTGAQDIGHWVIDPEATGDIIGWGFWPPSSRKTGAFANVFPSVVGLVGTPTEEAQNPSRETTPPGVDTAPTGGAVNPAFTPDFPGQTYVGHVRAHSPIQGPNGKALAVGSDEWLVASWEAEKKVKGVDAKKIKDMKAWSEKWNGKNIPAHLAGFGAGPNKLGVWPGVGAGLAPIPKPGVINLWNPAFPAWGGVLAGLPMGLNVAPAQWAGVMAGLQVNGNPNDPLFGLNVKPFQPQFVWGPQGDPNWNMNKAWSTKEKEEWKKKEAAAKAAAQAQQNAAWLSPMAAGESSTIGQTTSGPIFPIRGSGWAGDSRFSPLTITNPRGWPNFPFGYVGIVLPGTEEDHQALLYHPTDPRLVSSDKGDPDMGTQVCDPSNGTMDPNRQAPLQCLTKVVVEPTFKGSGKSFSGRNTLAWQVEKTGNGGTGGLVATGDGYGHVHQSAAGPFIVPTSEWCEHKLGTSEKKDIRPVHLDTRTLWADPYDQCGPLEIPGLSPISPPGMLDFPIKVDCYFDPDLEHDFLGKKVKGVFRWWTTAMDYLTPPPYDPQPPPPETPGTPTPPRDGRPPYVFSKPRGPLAPGERPVGAVDPTAYHPISYSVRERGFTSIVARPAPLTFGNWDYRYAGIPTKSLQTAASYGFPLTGRLEAFGALLGDRWDYTQAPRTGRHAGGTASGGFVLLPPEVDLSDPTPSGVPLSTTILIAGYGTKFAVGTPDLETGGVSTGATIGAIGKDVSVQRYSSGAVSGDPLALLNVAEVKHASSFLVPDLNDVTDDTIQKQIGIVTAGGSEALVVNIGGTLFSVALT